MNKIFCGAVAAALMVVALFPIGANASTLDFSFSFTNGSQNGGGVVSGVVRGLLDDTTAQQATSVEVTSNTAGFGVGIYNVDVGQSWTVSGGVITLAQFLGVREAPVIGCCVLTFSFYGTPGLEHAELEEAEGYADVDADPNSVGDLTFTALTAVPLPAGLPLLLAGLGALGLAGRRRGC